MSTRQKKLSEDTPKLLSLDDSALNGERAGKAKLFAKIAKIKGELSSIGKSGHNDFHRYSYATADDVFSAIRPLCAKHGIAIIPSLMKCEQQMGSKSLHTVAHFEFAVCDAETGHVFYAQWAGEALDNGDKGINKTATAAEKYFLLKLFMVPTDEQDADGLCPDINESRSPKSKIAAATRGDFL